MTNGALAADVELEWTALAGVQSSIGTPLTALDNPREPRVKVSLPVEASFLVVTTPGIYARVHFGAGLLLNGTFIFSTAGGEIVGFPHHMDGAVSVGLRRAGFSAGALAGFQFPSRPTVRGVLGWADEDGPLTVELRAGVNLPSDRALEPVIAVAVGLHGPVSRRGS